MLSNYLAKKPAFCNNIYMDFNFIVSDRMLHPQGHAKQDKTCTLMNWHSDTRKQWDRLTAVMSAA